MAGVASSNQERLDARSAALVQRLTGCHGDGKDVTDPRELYSILSQADAKRQKRCINVPILVCDSVLQQKVNREIKIKIQNDELDERPNTPPTYRQASVDFHDLTSSSDLPGLPDLRLVRQSSSLEDIRTLKRKGRDKDVRERVPGFLPWLSEKVVRVTFGYSSNDAECTIRDIADCTDIVLPKVPKVLEKTLPITKQTRARTSPNPDINLESSEPDNLVDPRLAGIPAEFIGRTQQILMEETFRERLRARGLGLHRNRDLFPRDNSRSADLKAYNLYPGQYWELRAETVQQADDLKTDMIDRSAYRMKQKSLLQLKVMDCEPKSKNDRSSCKPTPAFVQKFPPRQHKSKPTMADSLLPDSKEVGLSPFTNLMLGPMVAESLLASHAEPDDPVDPPNSRKGDNKLMFPYILSEEPLQNNVNQYHRYTQHFQMRTPRHKYMPPTSVVNLTIEQETPNRRNPRHIDANIKRQENMNKHGDPRQQTTALETFNTLSSVDTCGSRNKNEHDANGQLEPSTDETQHTKATLTGFKKLEPFAEMKRVPQDNGMSMSFKDIPNHRYMPQCHPPMYKLDLRNYPPAGNMLHVYQLGTAPHPMPGFNPLSLRLIDGGIIVSKVTDSGSQPQTSRTVKSDAVSSGHDSPWPVMSKS